MRKEELFAYSQREEKFESRRDRLFVPDPLYVDELQYFYDTVQKQENYAHIIQTPDGGEEFIHVLNPKKVLAGTRLVAVEMHDDDKEIAGGTLVKLAKAGVGITVITVTKGGAKPHNGYSMSDMAVLRQQEGVASAEEIGAGAYINLGYEDMRVGAQAEAIATTLTQYLRIIDPHVVVTLHPQDHNADHRNGAEIVTQALYRARNAIDSESFPHIPIARDKPSAALYFMDPQSLVDRRGSTIKPGMLVNIFPGEEAQKMASLRVYETQFENENDLWEFRQRGHERGKLIHLRHAEGLTQNVSGDFDTHDIIATILDKDVYDTQGLRYRARRILGFNKRTRPVIR